MADADSSEPVRNDPTAPLCGTTPLTGPAHDAPVLVVDDDKMYCLALRRFLKGRGLDVTVCHSVRQALSLPPDTYRAAVVDVYLEGDKDGLRLVRNLLTLQPALPVIVISGCSDDEVRQSVHESGASHFITKPFRLGHLLKVLDHLLAVRTSPGPARDVGEEALMTPAAAA